MPSPYTKYWDLDPNTTYLNHGSFGPSPIEVRAAREQWSAQLQQQPMKFFCRQMEEQLEVTATDLADFLHTKPARLALVDNATFAMNIAAATTELQPGDEVLLTDHEYGAVRNIWQAKCKTTGARLNTVNLPFPLTEDEIVSAVSKAITDNTRVIVISHVTSPTAVTLPVHKLCQLAKQHRMTSVVDGPHAVAMLDIHLDELGCDFYCGSCHKWLSAAFGSGFLWAHPRHHSRIQCPIISWGGSIAGRPACWQDRFNWLGTRDPAALLSISAAIEFLNRVGLNTFRTYASDLLNYAVNQLSEIEGIELLPGFQIDDVVSMCTIELPQPAGWKPGYHGQPDPLQAKLRDHHNIEIPIMSWNGRRLLRISAHLYNSTEDIDRLVEAVVGSVRS